MKRTLFTTSLCVLFTFVLLGCGGDDAATDARPADDGTEIVDETSPTTDEPSTSTEIPDDRDEPDESEPPATSLPDDSSDPEPEEPGDRWRTTPLARYWRYEDASTAAFWDRLQAEHWEFEEVVAACMAEQGFEYIPWVAPLHPAILADLAGASTELGADEYRAQYGYGISTGIGDPVEVVDWDPVDPNLAIRAAMGTAARAAYDRASESCGSHAAEATRSVEDDLREELRDEREQLAERIENDPRVVLAETEWARCMVQAGYAYASQADIIEDLQRRAQPFLGRGDPYEVLTQAEIDALTTEELNVVIAELMSLSPHEQAEVDELQAFELAVAAADGACGIPLDDVRYEVTVELEQQFVDEHFEILEAIVAAQER